MNFAVFKMKLAIKDAAESPKEFPPKGINPYRWKAMVKLYEKNKMTYRDICLSCKESMDQ